MLVISQFNTKLLNHIFNKANKLCQPHTLQYIIFPSRQDCINSFSDYVYHYDIEPDTIDHERLTVNREGNAKIKFISIRDLKQAMEDDGFQKEHPTILTAYHIYRFDTIYREYVITILNGLTEDNKDSTITSYSLSDEYIHLSKLHGPSEDLDEYAFTL